MKQNNILLKITDSAEFLEEFDAKISVSAWNKKEGYMIDEHITQQYPELIKKLELDEVQEGDMLYYGTLTTEQLANSLQDMGFEVEIET